MVGLDVRLGVDYRRSMDADHMNIADRRGDDSLVVV